MDNIINNSFINEIKALLHDAKNRVYQTINSTMTAIYWEIGRRIVEEEQGGEQRAKYGQELIKNLSKELTQDFGKGFSVDNIKNMRRFYLSFPKSETVSHQFKLSYSHYIFLTRITNQDERNFYEIESIQNKWSLRELKRVFNTGLFERLALSRDKAKIKELTPPVGVPLVGTQYRCKAVPNKSIRHGQPQGLPLRVTDMAMKKIIVLISGNHEGLPLRKYDA